MFTRFDPYFHLNLLQENLHMKLNPYQDTEDMSNQASYTGDGYSLSSYANSPLSQIFFNQSDIIIQYLYTFCQ